MAGFAHQTLTNSQPSPIAARPQDGWFPQLVATVRAWGRRIEQRRALARLTHHELADFGATSADVYRELNTPFWRSPPPC